MSGDALALELSLLSLASTGSSHPRPPPSNQSDTESNDGSERTWIQINSLGSRSSRGTSGTRSRDDTDTASLLSASSLTSDVVRNTNRFLQASNPRKLEIYQAFCIEFRATSPSDVPTSIIQCKTLLRQRVHINLKDYVAAKTDGKSVKYVKRYPSRKAVALDIMLTGKYYKLGKAKEAMFQPFLVQV